MKGIFEFYISFFLIALLTYEFIIECDGATLSTTMIDPTDSSLQ